MLKNIAVMANADLSVLDQLKSVVLNSLREDNHKDVNGANHFQGIEEDKPILTHGLVQIQK